MQPSNRIHEKTSDQIPLFFIWIVVAIFDSLFLFGQFYYIVRDDIFDLGSLHSIFAPTIIFLSIITSIRAGRGWKRIAAMIGSLIVTMMFFYLSKYTNHHDLLSWLLEVTILAISVNTSMAIAFIIAGTSTQARHSLRAFPSVLLIGIGTIACIELLSLANLILPVILFGHGIAAGNLAIGYVLALRAGWRTYPASNAAPPVKEAHTHGL